MQGGWVATKSRGREVSERSFCRKFVGLFVWWEGLNKPLDKNKKERNIPTK